MTAASDQGLDPVMAGAVGIAYDLEQTGWVDFGHTTRLLARSWQIGALVGRLVELVG